MVLSRLRRFFSSKPPSSAAYRRLHPNFVQQQTSPPRPLPVRDQDCLRLQTSPPRSLPISDGDCGRLQTTPPRSLPISDGDCGRLQTTPPRSLPISDGDCGRLQTTPPRPLPMNDGDCGRSGSERRTSAMYRIENELKEMNQDSPTHCSFGPVGDDVFRWEGVVIGPACSCYEGGIFRLSIDMPSDYPSSPPRIKFLTKIFHPNVEEDGTIHIDILQENWSPALTIEKLLLSICSILSNPDAEDSINKASIMCKNDWFSYCEVAREWTKKYAMES